MKTTLSQTGRVVLPGAARRRLGLRPGAKLACTVRDGGIVLTPESPVPARVKIGKSRHSGLPVLLAPAGTPPLTRAAVRGVLAGWP